MTQDESLPPLEYRPPRRWTGDQVAFGGAFLIAVGATVTLGFLVLPNLGPEAAGGLVILLILLTALGVFSGHAALRLGPIAIEDGVIHLPFPVKKADGKTRDVRLVEISDAEPTIQGGSRGLWLTFGNHNGFFLRQDQFGADGFQLMESISQAVGTSYAEAIRLQLLEGGEYRLRILKPKRMEGNRLLLRRGFRTFAGNRLRAIQPQDVVAVEEANPAYSDSGYLLTLREGSFVLLLKRDAAHLRLFHSREWGRLLTAHL